MENKLSTEEIIDGYLLSRMDAVTEALEQSSDHTFIKNRLDELEHVYWDVYTSHNLHSAKVGKKIHEFKNQYLMKVKEAEAKLAPFKPKGKQRPRKKLPQAQKQFKDLIDRGVIDLKNQRPKKIADVLEQQGITIKQSSLYRYIKLYSLKN